MKLAMAFDFYKFFLYFHISSAVISIGPLFALMPIINRLKNAKPSVEQAYLQVIRSIIRIIMHAGHVLVITGILLMIVGSWSWFTSWVMMTFVVLIISALFLATGFSNVLTKMNGVNSEKEVLVKKLYRTAWIYVGLMFILLWLMVAKPVLW